MNFGRFKRRSDTRKVLTHHSSVNNRNNQSQDASLNEPSNYSIYKAQNVSLPNHADSIMNGMDALWQQGTLCDANISSNGKVFLAHKILLAACSDYFHEIFIEGRSPSGTQIDGNNILLNDISPSTIEILLGGLYTGNITINEANVRELLAAAASLKIYAIEEACADFLRTRLNLSNCLRMLNLAYTYSLEDLEEDAMKIAAMNFIDISDGYDFKQLDFVHIVSLLQRDDLKADSELQVFQRSEKLDLCDLLFKLEITISHNQCYNLT